MHLDCQGSLLEIVGLETFISLTLNALHVHFNGLLWLTGMFEAISSLVI